MNQFIPLTIFLFILVIGWALKLFKYGSRMGIFELFAFLGVAGVAVFALYKAIDTGIARDTHKNKKTKT